MLYKNKRITKMNFITKNIIRLWIKILYTRQDKTHSHNSSQNFIIKFISPSTENLLYFSGNG